MRLALVGYMASGKSFWGKKISQAAGIQFIDLDSFLENEILGTSVSAYIAQNGELAFRKHERLALLEICEKTDDFIFATGGGTPCYYQNMDVLNETCSTIYLQAGVKFLSDRLIAQRTNRPLLAHLSDAELPEFVAKHLFERRPFYERAHFNINVAKATPNDFLKILP